MSMEADTGRARGYPEQHRTRRSSLLRRRSSLRDKFFSYYEDMKARGANRRERSKSLRGYEDRSIRPDSANHGHRHYVDENFRQERLDAARESLKKATGGTLKPKGYRRHETISAQASVWVPDYYHHPRTAAAVESYASRSNRPPPVAPPRVPLRPERPHGPPRRRSSASRTTPGRSSRDASRGEIHEGRPTRGWEETRSSQRRVPVALDIADSRAPTFDPVVWSPPKSANTQPTWQNKGLRHTGRLPQRSLGYGHQESVAVGGRRASASREVPRPKYEVYLQAQKETERMYDSRQRPLPKAPQSTRHLSQPRVPSSQEIKKTWLSSLGFGSGHQSSAETDSDVSFACEGARQIERSPYGAADVTRMRYGYR